MVIFQQGVGRADDHALNAAEAALTIDQRVHALNEERAPGLPAIELHMGLNTGEALVGATKLTGVAGPGEVVVGPETAARVRQRFVLELLGERTLKNVSAPVRCYRLVPPGVYDKVV